MKIKHFALFKENYEQLSWNQLRNSENEIHYYLPHSKEAYLKKVDIESPPKVIEDIINFLNLKLKM